MHTICPKCTMTLAVTANDLRMGQGYVRCGRCSNVFNALLTLGDETREPAMPPAAIPPAPTPAMPSPSVDPAAEARAEARIDQLLSSRQPTAMEHFALDLPPDSTATRKIRALNIDDVDFPLDVIEHTDSGATTTERRLAQPPMEAAPASEPPPPAPAPAPVSAPPPATVIAAHDPHQESTASDPTVQAKTATGTFHTIILEGDAATQTDEEVPEETVDTELAALSERIRQAARQSDDIHLASVFLADEKKELPRVVDWGTPFGDSSGTRDHGQQSQQDAQRDSGRHLLLDDGFIVEESDAVSEPPAPAAPPAPKPAPASGPASTHARLSEIFRSPPSASASSAAEAQAAPAATSPPIEVVQPWRGFADRLRPELQPEGTRPDLSSLSDAALPPDTRKRWALAAAAAALVLFGQIVHHWRYDWLNSPTFGGLVARTYSALGFPLAPRWDLYAYDIRQKADAHSDPNDPETIRIAISLGNTAKRAQPVPVIRVVVLDKKGQAVGARNLLPVEYWPAGQEMKGFLASDERIDTELALKSTGTDMSSDTLSVCLKDDHDVLRCTADQSTPGEATLASSNP